MSTEKIKKKSPGRPLKYNPIELQTKIDQYFIECENKKEFPNLAGLAVSLDVRRETIWDYASGGKNKLKYELSNCIKKAKEKIEGIIVANLLKTNGIGGMFYLKSAFGYKDKSEVEIQHKGNINVNVIRYESVKNENRKN